MSGRRIVLVDIGSGLTLSGILPSVALHGAYSAKLTARGGVAPYSFTTSSTLPDGVTLDRATGVLSAASVDTAGRFELAMTVTDLSGATATRVFVLMVKAEPLTLSGTFPDGQVGVAYSADLTISGGVPPYANARVLSGNLPTGLVVSLVGDRIRLSGVPTVNATFTAALAVDDAVAAVATSPVVIEVEVDYRTAVMTDSPLRFYRLADASGTIAADETGSADGSIVGAVSLNVDSINGDASTCMTFAGGRIEIGTPLGAGNPTTYSLEAWVRIDALPLSAAVVVNQGNGSASNCGMNVDLHGLVRADKYPPTGRWLGAGVLATGGVHHLVYTETPSRRRIYIDGAVAASDTAPESYSGVPVSRGAIGSNYDGTGSAHFTIKDVAIYATELSAARIAAHYNAGKLP